MKPLDAVLHLQVTCSDLREMQVLWKDLDSVLGSEGFFHDPANESPVRSMAYYIPGRHLPGKFVDWPGFDHQYGPGQRVEFAYRSRDEYDLEPEEGPEPIWLYGLLISQSASTGASRQILVESNLYAACAGRPGWPEVMAIMKRLARKLVDQDPGTKVTAFYESPESPCKPDSEIVFQLPPP